MGARTLAVHTRVRPDGRSLGSGPSPGLPGQRYGFTARTHSANSASRYTPLSHTYRAGRAGGSLNTGRVRAARDEFARSVEHDRRRRGSLSGRSSPLSRKHAAPWRLHTRTYWLPKLCGRATVHSARSHTSSAQPHSLRCMRPADQATGYTVSTGGRTDGCSRLRCGVPGAWVTWCVGTRGALGCCGVTGCWAPSGRV